MPKIEIRPAIADDIPELISLDHNYSSDYVWQMEIHREGENYEIQANFRQVRLPHSVKVSYPRSPRSLKSDWKKRSGLLVAVLDAKSIGYISLNLDIAPLTSWITDLVVGKQQRQQGIGTTLILAGFEWASNHDSRQLVLEMQPKNNAAVNLAQKLGFTFCGFNERYYKSNDIGLFFAKPLI